MGGGLYYAALSAGNIPPLFIADGAYTFRYAGQQVFEREPTRAQARWNDHPDPAPTSSQPLQGDAYYGVGVAASADYLGRRWILDSVDTTRIHHAKIMETWVGVAEGQEPSPQSPRRVLVSAPEEPPGGFEVPLWSVVKCGTPKKTIIWNTAEDPLGRSATPFELDRASATVQIHAVDSGKGTAGSGTVMSDMRHVLTAAHVIADGAGNALDSGGEDDDWSMYVCTYGNMASAVPEGREGSCFPVGWVHPKYEYDGTGSAYDFGIVTLVDANALDAPYNVGTIKRNTRTDNYSGESQTIRGYSGYDEDCGVNSNPNDDSCLGCDFRADKSVTADGSYQYNATGLVTASGAKTLTYNLSNGLGMSGGPIYYFYGSTAVITGVLSQSLYPPVTVVQARGPRSSYFSPWVDGYVP